MHKAHGIERSIISPLNPYLSSSFYHTIKSKDIFKDYDKHLKREGHKKYRKAKRRIKDVTQEEYENFYHLPKKIFNFAIHYIIFNVIKGNFRFFLPEDLAIITIDYNTNPSKKSFEYYGVDPLKVNFVSPKLLIKFTRSKKVFGKSLIVSKLYKKLIAKRLLNHDTFDTAKDLRYKELAQILKDQYYSGEDITNEQIEDILFVGFHHLYNGLKNKIDYSFVRNNSKRLDYVLFKGSSTRSAIVKTIRKHRFLYYYRKTKYSGWYYFALTNQQFNLFFHEDIDNAKLFKVEEESMLLPLMKPHIFKVKIKNEEGYTLIKNIKYEANNTKYIWRWNGKRFEPTDNSKLRTY